MTAWFLAAAIGIAAAAFQYARMRAPSVAYRGMLAALRAIAIALAIALLLDAPLGRQHPLAPAIFVAASASIGRGSAQLWREALDSARAIRGDSIWLFGASARGAAQRATVADAATRVRPVIERTMTTGRPAVLITDGEIQDSTALDGLASGSRLIVLLRAPQRDLAIVGLEVPHAAVDGDSITVRATFASGALGASAGSLTLQFDAQLLGRWPLDSMSPWGERQLDLRVRATGASNAGVAGARVLRAWVASS